MGNNQVIPAVQRFYQRRYSAEEPDPLASDKLVDGVLARLDEMAKCRLRRTATPEEMLSILKTLPSRKATGKTFREDFAPCLASLVNFMLNPATERTQLARGTLA